MKRSMMQVYVKDSKKAVDKYVTAFGGEILSKHMNEVGGYYHCEIKIDNVVLALSEVDDVIISDSLNVMQFCLHYNQDEATKIHHAFQILGENSTVHFPLGSTDYAKVMVDFTDEFSVRWCLFC